jgi:hypothetical protein
MNEWITAITFSRVVGVTFNLFCAFVLLQTLYKPESIECFLEDQAVLPPYDLAPPHPPSLRLLLASYLSFSMFQCVAGRAFWQRRWTWTGDFKCREVKTGFCRKRWTQTGSSGTLIGWKSGQTTFIPLWDRMEGAWLWTQERGGSEEGTKPYDGEKAWFSMNHSIPSDSTQNQLNAHCTVHWKMDSVRSF